MKILFIIRSPQIFHYYESIYDALLKRGHNIELLFDKNWGENEYIGDVKFGFSWAVPAKKNFKWRILLFFREVLSWRRYLLLKEQSSFYAQRWLKYISPKFRFLVSIFPFIKIFIKTKFVGNFLKNFEKNTPPDEKIIEDIKKRAPDVVLVTPVNFRQSSSDLEYLKAAKFLKIPVALPVISWDNLTTKGLIHIVPDILMVWNEAQAKEAEEHHEIPKKNIKIVGAPFFDKWFNKNFTQESEKFEDSAIPKILYLGSSDNIAPDERWLIKEIKEALNNSLNEKIYPPKFSNKNFWRVKNTQIIFRPHPANYKIYKDFSLEGVFVQKEGSMPKTAESFKKFYDMLSNSCAVISINTSGMVDAILAGKPVISLEREEFKKTQALAQHYKHMRESNALYVTKTTEEFLEVFSKLLSGEDFKKGDREKFIRQFIRPRGLEYSAGEMVAYEVEELAKGKNAKK